MGADMRRFIRICEDNKAMSIKDQLTEEAHAYGYEIVTAQCLNRCAFCDETPYVLVGSRVVFGDDVSELLEALKEALLSQSK